MTNLGFPFKYLASRFNSGQFLFEGLLMAVANFLTANCMSGLSMER